MSSPILLVLGAGPNIGRAVCKSFVSAGYKVALASRKTPTESSGEQVHIPVDVSNPENIPRVYEIVKEKLGAAPSVVVYNCAAATMNNKTDPLADFSLKAYFDQINVNNASVLVSLQQAISGFRSLSDSSASKTFIFTGNVLNLVTSPRMMTFGLSKNATAYAIRTLVEGKVYEGEGISIYYADERTSTGQPVYNDLDGPAAAEEYVKLAEHKGQGPWLHTYAKGEGYKEFGEVKL